MNDLSNQNRISARVLYLLAIIGLGLMIAIATPGGLLAHANLSTADPAPNSVLDDPPEQVAIRFTEPLEAKLSEIRVLNSQAQRVDNDDHSLDVNDSHVLWVTLKPMENGTYTVAWKNVSTVDGHLVRGSYIFSVGEPLQASAMSLEVDETLFQSPAEPIIRWLVLLGALAAVGGLAFELLVTRPSLRQVVSLPGAQDFGDSLQSRTHWLIWVSLALLLVASIAQATMQAVAVFESSVFGALGDPLKSIVTETGWGRIWLWRVVMLALMAVAFGASVRISDPKRRLILRILTTIFGLALLWTLSLASHAAATTGLRLEAMINDFLHLVAVAAWVGGLFYLVQATPLALRLPDESDRRELLSAIVPRFSMIAAVSVAVLIVTGVFSAWAQVTALPAMAVPYGSALVAKLVVVALLLILGAINLIWVKPRLGQPGNAAVWLKRLVIGEVALAILAILSTGFLTGLEPARQVASREGIGVEDLSSFEDTVEGADITVNVEPGQLGPNTVTVDLKDRFGNPITNATDVFVRLTYLDADLGEEPKPAVSTGNGQWTLNGGLLSIAGAWRVEVLVTRPDAFDARTAFNFAVSSGGGRGSDAIFPKEKTGTTFLGVELGLAGFIALVIGITSGGWYTRKGAMTMGPGIVVAMVGIVLIFNTQFAGQGEGLPERNPIPPTSESVAIGLQGYSDNCQLCHGEDHRGTGPAAAGLNPPPADLVVHIPLHPDRALYEFIHDGISGTAMAPLGDKLTDDEIWHLINYLRTIK